MMISAMVTFFLTIGIEGGLEEEFFIWRARARTTGRALGFEGWREELLECHVRKVL